MRIIPVIDVMGGQVVRAVGGQRSEYRPIVSPLTKSSDPNTVARCLLAESGADEIYIADLDAITGSHVTSEPVLRFVRQLAVTCWLDVGVHGTVEILDYPLWNHIRPIVALESLCSPLIREPSRSHSDAMKRHPAFSLDLRDGKPSFGYLPTWDYHPKDAVSLGETVFGWGFRTLIVIDISRVGGAVGPGTESVCRELKYHLPEMEILAGGGIRDWDDIRRLEDAGADGVLVASALHDGTLTFPRPTS